MVRAFLSSPSLQPLYDNHGHAHSGPVSGSGVGVGLSVDQDSNSPPSSAPLNARAKILYIVVLPAMLGTQDLVRIRLATNCCCW